jgi:predicted nucleic acid-binding protein
MIAYIDSSVLLRILLDEEGKIEAFKKIELGISSVLLKIECLRTLDRIKFENHYSDDEYMESRALFLAAFKKISFIKLSNSIVESSCRPWGIPVKSLDAIHLASALQWKQSEEKNLTFLTHDKRLGNAAKSNGLDVFGI